MDIRDRPRRVNGYDTFVNPARLRQFHQLQALRGGRFSDALAPDALWILGGLLRAAREDRDGIRRALRRFGKRHGLTTQAVDAMVERVTHRRFSLKNITIAQHLVISPEESEQLSTWPPSPVFKVKRKAKLTKEAERIRKRWGTILAILALHPDTPSLRSMARLLAQEGIDVSFVQVMKDYKALKVGKWRDVGSGLVVTPL